MKLKFLKILDECGLVYAESNVRIVGGVDAAESSWPWAALVIFHYVKPILNMPDGTTIYNKTFSYTCGGTLINRRTILTAAHCSTNKLTFTYDYDTYYFEEDYEEMAKGFTIFLGMNNITDIIETGYSATGVSSKVSKVIIVSI